MCQYETCIGLIDCNNNWILYSTFPFKSQYFDPLPVNHPSNPQEFLSGGWDGDIHVWDARRPHSVRRFRGPFIAGEGVDIDKKGREIAVACWRGQHQLQARIYIYKSRY